jgi:hypothetical protein
MSGFVARCPDNHHHPVREEADCLEACLPVVTPRVLDGIVEPAKTTEASAKFKPL